MALIWLWITLFVANFYPLVDGGFKMIWTVLKGKSSTVATAATVSGQEQGEKVRQEEQPWTIETSSPAVSQPLQAKDL